MKKRFYITITDTECYYGKAPFEVGVIMKLTKIHGKEAEKFDIRVTMPLLGTLGRVAVSSFKVAKGTVSGKTIYRQMDEVAYAQIMFVTDNCVIAKFLKPDEVLKTPYLRAYIKKPH